VFRDLSLLRRRVGLQTANSHEIPPRYRRSHLISNTDKRFRDRLFTPLVEWGASWIAWSSSGLPPTTVEKSHARKRGTDDAESMTCAGLIDKMADALVYFEKPCNQ